MTSKNPQQTLLQFSPERVYIILGGNVINIATTPKDGNAINIATTPKMEMTLILPPPQREYWKTFLT